MEGLLKSIYKWRGAPAVLILFFLARKPLLGGLVNVCGVLSVSQSQISALLAQISTKFTPLFRFPWFRAPRLNQCSLYATYTTTRDEARYWRTSARHRRLIDASDARTATNSSSTLTSIPLVTYYTPRLLPSYRDCTASVSDTFEFRISARIFCKWHRMVFRGPLHPTLTQAASLMKYHSPRDLREIHRIAHLLPDAEVFNPLYKRTNRYKRMWKDWLERKGPDLTIVFE
ncbi:hypothetical protein BJ138DRAFT_1168400 [Hygrophoropsis aurantiaca]|uniref:Uncharacterized protein n=1 Tax=Hygrophoropsis aurantiaca TaxID=72124 RepID=A0ACB7ZRC9_9AGAM|nr:hypothetical protein BJ138DRAFT_1168400 [Hygrophoropsis aurantiaca]